MKALVVEGIEKGFAGVQAVKGVSFTANRGEILGLLGPNGAGKTTTIRMIMGIIRPDRGRISFFLNGVQGALNKERIGYLPEERGLYSDARVLETLVYFAGLKGVPSGEARRRALQWLQKLDLAERSERKIQTLSKGMQQKVQFLAAVLHKPDLVVLDEPFGGLDPANQDLFREFIRDLKEDGMAVLLSSHQMNLVEALCDRIFLIGRGQQVLYGELDEIKANFGEHLVRLRFQGDASSLRANREIKDLEITGDRARGKLPKGVPPKQFLQSIPNDLLLEEITVERPPLHDIFVSITGGHNETA
ncbi:TPA: ABC transporter ATP-binding protein [Candidatus Acetothermia bacterium]|nr:ABC transporter ATP-binding protein [Candidatus Acetothermia bacterium]